MEGNFADQHPKDEIHRPEDITAQGMDLAASLVRDLFVDFFGSLVPGFLFTVVSVPMVIWTGATLLPSAQGHWTAQSWPDFVPKSFLVALVIVISYVLGHMFSRRDPKIPDQKSIAHILCRNWGDLDRGVVQPNKFEREKFIVKSRKGLWSGLLRWFEINRKARALARCEGGQFPYSHLRTYLSERGLDHLARHIPWDGDSKEINKRSKVFINLLKIRIQYWNSRKCGDIIRNEAHVRMMSSVWFAARSLQQVYGILLIAVMIGAYFRHQWIPPWDFQPDFPFTIVVVLLALLVVFIVLRRAVIYFLHYQRVREIVYVLATAHASWHEGNVNVFEGFEVPKEEHSQARHQHSHDPSSARHDDLDRHK